jgi:hypothetical protein
MALRDCLDQDREGGLRRWVCATSSTASSRISQAAASTRTLLPHLRDDGELSVHTEDRNDSCAARALLHRHEADHDLRGHRDDSLPLSFGLYNVGFQVNSAIAEHTGRRAGAHGSLRRLGHRVRRVGPGGEYPARGTLFPADIPDDADRRRHRAK